MKIKPESFRWALHSIGEFGDNDLFASPVELSILALLAAQPRLNDISAILRRYGCAFPTMRREIILCAAGHGAMDWILELKGEFDAMDPWNRRAFLYAAASLPQPERKLVFKQLQPSGLLEELMLHRQENS